MFRKLLRICLTIAGASIGYGFCMILRHLFRFYNVPVEETIGTTQFMVISIFVAIIIGIIFFRISPAIGRGGKKVASEIERDLRDVATQMECNHLALHTEQIYCLASLCFCMLSIRHHKSEFLSPYVFEDAHVRTRGDLDP